MMKVMKRIVVMYLIVAICLLLSACGENDVKKTSSYGGMVPEGDEAYNVAFVLVIANNNPVVDLSKVEEFTSLSSHPGTTYSFILADSTPSVIFSETIPDFTTRHYSRDMLDRVEQSIQADLSGKVADAAPDADQVDMAKALEMGTRTIQASRVDGRKNILVVYGSGISTAGEIDMTAVPLYGLDIQTSVKRMDMSMDMTGITVSWYCAGDAAGHQAELNSFEKENLRNFYEKLFMEYEAESVVFQKDLPSAETYQFPYEVTSIETQGTKGKLEAKTVESSAVANAEQTGEIFAEGTGGMIVFTEETIEFLPDSAELRDREAASKALEYVVMYMCEHEDFELLILGTTSSAGDDETANILFSEIRANTVKELLLREGISGDRVHCLGCGFSCGELYEPDRNPDGSLNETAAQRNRKVVFLDKNSDTAAWICEEMTSFSMN